MEFIELYIYMDSGMLCSKKRLKFFYLKYYGKLEDFMVNI